MKFFITHIEPVAMREKETFASKLHSFGFAMHLKADFIFEIAKSPDVVIAGKEMNFDTRIG